MAQLRGRGGALPIGGGGFAGYRADYPLAAVFAILVGMVMMVRTGKEGELKT